VRERERERYIKSGKEEERERGCTVMLIRPQSLEIFRVVSYEEEL
jgi:hypothetical protein